MLAYSIRLQNRTINTAEKMKFSSKIVSWSFFSKYDQSNSFLRIWSHLLKKSVMENAIFLCSVTKANSSAVFKIWA